MQKNDALQPSASGNSNLIIYKSLMDFPPVSQVSAANAAESKDIPENIHYIPEAEVINSGKRIANSNTTIIWAGRWKNFPVAIKSIQSANTEKKIFMEREATILSELHHERIVKLYGVVKTTIQYSLLLELVHKEPVQEDFSQDLFQKDLFDLIEKQDSVDYVSIGFDIASALKYLHENNYIHGDIKSENVFVGPDGHVKLGDFGFAEKLNKDGISYRILSGTISNMAPEYFLPSGYRCKGSDIYALGVVLWEMVSHVSFLSRCVNYNQMIECIKEHNLEEIPESCDSDVANLIKKCWNSDPALRPSACDVVGTLFNKLCQRKQAIPDAETQEVAEVSRPVQSYLGYER